MTPKAKRGQAPRTGGEHVLCAIVTVDSRVVARGSATAGPDLGCDDLEETFYSALHQRGVSGLCHSSSLESGGRGGKGVMATTLGGSAATPGGECAGALGSDRDE